MKRSLKRGIVFLFIAIMLMQSVIQASADSQIMASDVTSKVKTKDFTFTRSMKSIDPSVASNNLPADIKTITFKARLTCSMQYDRVSGKFIAASSPDIMVQPTSKVYLSLSPASTWYKDNGSSVTFYFSGTVIGRCNSDFAGVPVVINYGSISGNYTVNK